MNQSVMPDQDSFDGQIPRVLPEHSLQVLSGAVHQLKQRPDRAQTRQWPGWSYLVRSAAPRPDMLK
jgi:hypothetical protein